MSVFSWPVFYLNDDVTMRSILSGSYTGTPDGHAVYMKYPLTGILSGLYKIAGDVPWLELFFIGCILWALAELVMNVKHKKTGLLFGGLFLLPFYLYMHYTVIAAILVGTTAYLVCAGKSRIKPVLFWLLAWMVRSQVAYLALPFLGVALLWKLQGEYAAWKECATSEAIAGNIPKASESGAKFNKKEAGRPGVLIMWKKELRGWLKTGCMALAGFLVCTGLHHLCYAGKDWQAYLKYNDARTTLYDYTDFLSTDFYAENYEKYAMTESQFIILNSYNTLLDHSIDEEKMEQVAATVSEGMTSRREGPVWLKESVKQYYYQIRYGESIYVWLWLAIFGGLALVVILGRDWISLLLLGCYGGGRSLIWVFLIWKGRFPERIAISLYVIELLLLVGMWSLQWDLQKRNFEKLIMYIRKSHKFRPGLAVAGRVCLAGMGIMLAGLLVVQIRTDAARAVEKKTLQQEWNVLKEYCGNDCDRLYLIDVFSAVEYSGLSFERDSENLMLAGGWMSASPLAAERFHAFEAGDGAEALFGKDQVSFLAQKDRDLTWLEDYLQERFGACALQATSEIPCSPNKVFVEYKVVK